MKTNKNIAGLVFVLVLATSLILAVGVSQPYWEGNPLKISPGETETVELTLQNMVGDSDITLRAVLIDGAGIASLPSRTDYDVALGTADTTVPVTIRIPSDAPLGSEHTVMLSFKTVTPGEEGGVSLGLGYEINFDVLVVEETEQPASSASNLVWWIIGIIIVIIVIWIIMKAMKNKQANTSSSKK